MYVLCCMQRYLGPYVTIQPTLVSSAGLPADLPLRHPEGTHTGPKQGAEVPWTAALLDVQASTGQSCSSVAPNIQQRPLAHAEGGEMTPHWQLSLGAFHGSQGDTRALNNTCQGRPAGSRPAADQARATRWGG